MDPVNPGSEPKKEKVDKIEVVKNPFPGIVDPEKIDVDIFDLIHDRISKKENLTLRLPESDPRKQGMVLGYYPHYGVAYISSPENKQTIFAIDSENKTLVVDFNVGAFYDQRDGFVYRDMEGIEIQTTFQKFLQGFASKGYVIKKFEPKSTGDYVISYREADKIPRSEYSSSVEDVLEEMTK